MIHIITELVTELVTSKPMLTELVTSKPMLGAFAGIGGFWAAVLLWMKVLSVPLGFASLVIGLIVGCVALKNQIKWAREHKKTDLPPPET